MENLEPTEIPQSSSRQLEGQATPQEPTRVCDTCIRKKAKCDQERPTCSRCFQRGETCTYSSKRRKPGPARGSRTIQRPQRSQRSPSGSEPSTTLQTAVLDRGPAQRPILESSYLPLSGISPQTSETSQSTAQYEISAQQEEYLLDQYFEIANDANPFFSKEKFLRNYKSSLIDQGLVFAIVTITARLTGFKLFPDEATLNARIDLLLGSSLLEDDLIGDSPSLDQFRKACILALYDFHQFPGHQSWMRIGRLTRMAYRIGLDRLEPLRALYSDWGCLSREDMQEWRAVWWCIYRLDSYTNLSCGTPYLIDNKFVNTSLMLDQQTEMGNDSNFPVLYLPPDSEDLWRLLPTITSNPKTQLQNIHIVSIAATRQAGLVAGIRLLRPESEIATHLAKFERHLSALSLALPPGWFNPRRNAFNNESPSDHHARLITVFHLHMAKLLSSIIVCGRAAEDIWLGSWQQVLETCQDIAQIAGQWNSSFCMQVDPAICFIIFTALIFLDLHLKSTAMGSPELQSHIDHDKTVLRLQLEHFAKDWTLPRLLTLSFASVSESVTGPLSHAQITLILSRFEAPLHPRWLGFLSTAQAALQACR